jgi:hypothetical protein
MLQSSCSEDLKGVSGLTILPIELIESLIELIDDPDLCTLRLTCKRYNDLIIHIVSRLLPKIKSSRIMLYILDGFTLILWCA